MNIQSKRLIGIFVGVGLLLLIPFIAMKFTSDVKWTGIDFMTAGILLLGTGLVCEFVLRKVTNIGPRIAFCAGVLAILCIIWAELAVGLIGTPLAGN